MPSVRLLCVQDVSHVADRRRAQRAGARARRGAPMIITVAWLIFDAVWFTVDLAWLMLDRRKRRAIVSI